MREFREKYKGCLQSFLLPSLRLIIPLFFSSFLPFPLFLWQSLYVTLSLADPFPFAYLRPPLSSSFSLATPVSFSSSFHFTFLHLWIPSYLSLPVAIPIIFFPLVDSVWLFFSPLLPLSIPIYFTSSILRFIFPFPRLPNSFFPMLTSLSFSSIVQFHCPSLPVAISLPPFSSSGYSTSPYPSSGCQFLLFLRRPLSTVFNFSANTCPLPFVGYLHSLPLATLISFSSTVFSPSLSLYIVLSFFSPATSLCFSSSFPPPFHLFLANELR